MIREANKNDLDEILQLYYKRATMEDIDELVRTRIIVLRAANKLSDDEDMSVVEEKSYAYYRRALESGEHIAYLVYDNGKFIGAGGVSFYQVMPTYHNPTGKKAYIMNMYTAPEYRRQGIAIHTLDLLVKYAKEQGVLQITLEATDMGRPLYERCKYVCRYIGILLYGSGQVVIWKVDGYMKEKEHQSIEWKESWQDEC